MEGGGGVWWVIQILSDRDDQCILLGLNIISILEFLGEERFGEYFLCLEFRRFFGAFM